MVRRLGKVRRVLLIISNLIFEPQKRKPSARQTPLESRSKPQEKQEDSLEKSSIFAPFSHLAFARAEQPRLGSPPCWQRNAWNNRPCPRRLQSNKRCPAAFSWNLTSPSDRVSSFSATMFAPRAPLTPFISLVAKCSAPSTARLVCGAPCRATFVVSYAMRGAIGSSTSFAELHCLRPPSATPTRSPISFAAVPGAGPSAHSIHLWRHWLNPPGKRCSGRSSSAFTHCLWQKRR